LEKNKQGERKSSGKRKEETAGDKHLSECSSRGILKVLKRSIASSIGINQIACTSRIDNRQILSSAVQRLGKGPSDAGSVSLAQRTAVSRIRSARAIARTDSAEIGLHATATDDLFGGREGAEILGARRAGVGRGWWGRRGNRTVNSSIKKWKVSF
jgi:hypothetical protein